MSQDSSPKPGSKRGRSAPLTMPQDVRKEALQPDQGHDGSNYGAKPEVSKIPSSAAKPGSSIGAAKARPLDPMSMMMPWIKSSVAYSTAAAREQLKLYDMMMQMTPMGAIARQQAQIGNSMMQAMAKSSPLCMWGRKK